MSKFKVEFVMYDIREIRESKTVEYRNESEALSWAEGYSEGLKEAFGKSEFLTDYDYAVIPNWDEIRIYNERGIELSRTWRRVESHVRVVWGWDEFGYEISEEVPF